jgi:predicted phosphodiesterase
MDVLISKGMSSVAASQQVAKQNKVSIKPESLRIAYFRQKRKTVKKAVSKTIKAKPTNAFSGILEKLKPNPNPLGLPESKENAFAPFKLDKSVRKILFLSDIHVPYHNIEALTVALKHGLEEGCDTVYLNGDVIDFYAISSFDKDPRKRNFGEEVMKTREFLSLLRGLFPKAHIYYKCGNHDVRYERYLMKCAPDLFGLGEYNLETLLHLEQNNIIFIPDKQIVHAGKLTMIHGHELGKTIMSPVNVARGLYLRTKESSICGHSHQTSQHVEKSVNGKVTSCWSVGCLCELHPDYAPINKYNHGFAIIDIFENGDFEVFNHTIVNGKIR